MKHTGLWHLELPDDLDQYLAESESHFQDITPDTEKQIVWANRTHSQTEYAVIFFHGFSATRQELAPLCDLVANEFGANLFYTRLAGHGRGCDAMKEPDVNSWLVDASEAYAIGKRIGKKIILIGNSTGATLATWLTSQVADQSIAAQILLAPNFSPRDPLARLLTWPLLNRILVRLIVGKHRSWEPDNEQHARYWTPTYPSEALIPMMKLVTLVERTDKTQITTPTQIIYSPRDEVISFKAIERTFEEFGAKKKNLVRYADAEDPRQHILAGDIISPGSTQPLSKIICQFINEAESIEH